MRSSIFWLRVFWRGVGLAAIPLLLLLVTGIAQPALETPLVSAVPEVAESIPLIKADRVHELGITGEGVGILIIDEFDPTPGIGIRHGDVVRRIAYYVAPGANIYHYDVNLGDPDVDGDDITIDDALEAVLQYKDDYNIRVVNMSWGGSGTGHSAPCSHIWRSTLYERLNAAGIVLVASSGNNSLFNAMGAPACHPDVVSVGATYDGDMLFNWDCPGEVAEEDKVVCYSNSAWFLDVLAPGTRIVVPEYGLPQRFLQLWSGTSWSAPHVTGVIALMLEANPNLTPEEVRSVLRETGKPVVDHRNGLTFPRVDALAAVQAVLQKPEAKIVVQDAWLSPTRINAGEDVSIYIELENQGERGGSVRVTIRANGDIVIDSDEWIGPGREESFTYEVSFSEPGSYDITMDVTEGDHFIGTVAVRRAGPDFLLHDAWFEPPEVAIGDTISVYLDVENANGPGEFMVRIYDNGNLAINTRASFRAGERRTLSYQLRMKTAGKHRITVSAPEGRRLVGTIRVGQVRLLSIEEALDSNRNNIIDDDEILQAVSYWISGEPVPGTDGEVINDAKMLELVEMWIAGKPISSSARAAESKRAGVGIESLVVSPNPAKGPSARFKVEGADIVAIKVQVFSLAGHPVYEGGFISGRAFDWELNNNEGEIVANGVYLYVVTVKGSNGNVTRSKVKKLVVLRPGRRLTTGGTGNGSYFPGAG